MLWMWLAVAQIGGPVEAQRLVADLRYITAESAPYTLVWDGDRGTFSRAPLGSAPGLRWPVVYLHTDPGPKGYARYLAWFLARDKNDFALLWCYLNDSGREFWCWLYQFSSNQLTTVRFKGDYRFTPLPEPRQASVYEDFALTVVPSYTGPDFTFRDWTRREGRLDRLEVRPAGSDAAGAAVATTLTGLRVQPLHDLSVPAGNGWREVGWRELHALAYDRTDNPFYLILYSNSTRGFVLDLKRALTYVADFGAMVRFGPDSTRFGNPTVVMVEPLEIRAQRYEPFEVTLPSFQPHENPFTEVLLEADVRSPDGRRFVVPGFWDGGKTWRLRFTPTRVGTWTWRTRSNDPDLHGQQGEVECVADEQIPSTFLKVNPSAAYRHHFIRGEDTPFYPAFLCDPVHWEPRPAGGPQLAAQSGSLPASPADDLPETFRAFQQRIDLCAQMGINRLFGGYLFDLEALDAGRQTNEGGVPFFDNDPSRPNPAYFQWMDRRILYCNARGIVPDVGLGVAGKLFERFSEEDLRRIWRYLLARYAAYNVCWNLFRADGDLLTPDLESRITLLGGLTRLYDPHVHPLTLVIASPGAAAAGATSTREAVPPAARDAAPDGAEGARRVAGSAQRRPGLPRQEVEPAPPVDPAPLSGQSWMDVITLANASQDALWRNWQQQKPVVVVEDATTDPEILRRRMWETRMLGGYWAGSPTVGPDGTLALDTVPAQAAAACARFFQRTRFWRLAPRPELLGGPQEDPNIRRRRKRLEAESARQRTRSDGSRTQEIPQPPPPADGPIYLLADPAWEYVVYFTRGGGVLLDLLEATGRIRTIWFNPRTGEIAEETTTMGGQYRVFTAPDKNDWVLYLSRR